MKRQIAQTVMFAAIMGLTLVARGGDESDQSEFPLITSQPVDEAIQAGSSTTFTVQATNGDLAFQWLRNGIELEGRTNNSLTLDNVGTNDVGYYSCAVTRGSETVPTRSASLNVFIQTAGEPITVFGTPLAGSGSQGTCPGPYAGYVNYTKTVSQGWGWAPSAGVTNHTATDVTRTDTKVQYLGKTGDKGCAQTTVAVPHPTISTKYRFTIYFPNNVPTNSYPIVLEGFDP